MKRLTLSTLALILATSGGAVMAGHGHGDDDQGDYHSDHHGGYHDDHGRGHKYGHYKNHWYPRPHYREVYYYPRHGHYNHHDHDSDYYAPLGAALIGAAVTYSIFHADDTSYPASRSSAEVVGCHRIERYPDGSERRVEVPVEECY